MVWHAPRWRAMQAAVSRLFIVPWRTRYVPPALARLVPCQGGEESDRLRKPMKRGAWLAASLVLATAQGSPSSLMAPESSAASPDVVGAEQARMTCLRFVHVRLGVETTPISIETRPVPAQAGQWWVGGNVKGPEGPLLFACHLRQGARWELLDFALWAARPPV